MTEKIREKKAIILINEERKMYLQGRKDQAVLFNWIYKVASLNVKECKDVTGFNPKEKGMKGFFAFFQVELRFYPCHRKPNTYAHRWGIEVV